MDYIKWFVKGLKWGVKESWSWGSTVITKVLWMLFNLVTIPINILLLIYKLIFKREELLELGEEMKEKWEAK